MSVTFDSSQIELEMKLESKETNEKEDYFFEGAEKLLEIWFAKEDESGGSLRKIPRNEIEKMLAIAECRILHERSNGSMDSYVLSESSLFVSDQRMILKTCGNTRLLDALPYILSLAKRYGGFDIISNVYYSRKNFIRPNLQPDPHKSFSDEVEYLLTLFPSGEAFCLGPMNSADCWYLFAMNSTYSAPTHVDHTLEIQMTDLPPEVLKLYSKASFANGRACTRASGLMDLIPFGTIVHEELFEPVGYSMNGLVANTDQYVTVHVTPEPQFAYVSFETNQRRKCLYQQTLKVLECFKPRKFILTMFTNNESHNGKSSQQLLWNREIPNYQRVSLQFIRLVHDTLVYAQFIQVPNGKIRREISRIPPEEDEDSNGNSD